MNKPATEPLSSAQPTSRRSWLKGFGALLGTSLLAPATTLLATPKAAGNATAVEAGAALVGGDEFIGMVKLLPGTTVPAGWTLCDGRMLAIDEYPALYAVMGVTYGGNGRTTFALPDMRADMADMAAAAALAIDNVPLGQLCVVKVANAPALTNAVAELRLQHLRRTRPASSRQSLV